MNGAPFLATRESYTHQIPNQGSMGCADWIKGDSDGFDLWIVAGCKFRPIALLHFCQNLFYFRNKLLPVFDSRREYRPVQPLYEIVSIHQGRWDEIEPGGRGVNVF